MSQQMLLDLTVDYPRLQAILQNRAEIIELELADRSLKRGLFAQFSSAKVARSVASEVVSLLQLSLAAGDLTVFQAQFKWEIGVALNHHRFFKLNNDLALIATLQEVMLEQLPPALQNDIKAFTSQVRTMFVYSWKEAEQNWRQDHPR